MPRRGQGRAPPKRRRPQGQAVPTRPSNVVPLASANRPKPRISIVRPQGPTTHVAEVDRDTARRHRLLVQCLGASWHATAIGENGGFIVVENVTTKSAIDLAKAWRSFGGVVEFEPKELDPWWGQRA